MGIATQSGSTNDELAAAVALGDQGAFAELYDRLAPEIFGRVMNQVDDAAAAEEIVANVFLEFWRQAPRLDRFPGGVSAWLLTAAQVRRTPEALRRAARVSRTELDRVG